MGGYHDDLIAAGTASWGGASRREIRVKDWDTRTISSTLRYAVAWGRQGVRW
jgi:hypothetical protein